MINQETELLKREWMRATDGKGQGVVKRKALKMGYRLIPSMFGCHFERVENVPQETDKVISVMESEWKRLKEIEKMYFELLEQKEGLI